MQISELADRAGVTVKAVRYYERLGLLAPRRLRNGYRDYDDRQLRAAREIRELAAVGIPPSKAAPFIACLGSGHARSDECPASVVAYADGIAELDAAIAALEARREQLLRRLASATDAVAPSPDQGTGCTVVDSLLGR
jgi:DNA-binding transcriptional MerR regulator